MRHDAHHQVEHARAGDKCIFTGSLMVRARL